MGECHSSRKPGAIRCFRTQCTDDELAVITNTSTLCAVCGLEGDKRCGKCKSVQYCSKQHQILHWNEHRDSCCSSSNNTASSTSSLLFPVREIITEDDDYEGRVKEELLMEGSVSGVNGMQVSTSVTADVEEEEEVMAVDKAFLRFQKRVRFAPDQILRYVRTGETQEKMEEPLWVSDESKPSASDIPDCSSCGQQRTFEFQVMPQLLNYLNLNHVATESLDFGTLLVYTCDSPQCRQKSGKYVEEFVWRQDFSQHSAALSSKQ